MLGPVKDTNGPLLLFYFYTLRPHKRIDLATFESRKIPVPSATTPVVFEFWQGRNCVPRCLAQVWARFGTERDVCWNKGTFAIRLGNKLAAAISKGRGMVLEKKQD